MSSEESVAGAFAAPLPATPFSPLLLLAELGAFLRGSLFNATRLVAEKSVAALPMKDYSFLLICTTTLVRSFSLSLNMYRNELCTRNEE